MNPGNLGKSVKTSAGTVQEISDTAAPIYSILQGTYDRSSDNVYFVLRCGEAREIVPKPGDIILTADDRPNGEWAFLDKENGVAIVNRFNPEQVFTCVIHWSAGICNLELWSEERPVSKETPFQICHEYETVSEQELLQSQT
ncbi:hypothetical protein AXG93_502s1000 [Marchantia polymorpha subsp. ruderalis]|uniref:Uncharacterized protein n=1 Tax=Marchantia polymorpha subsp. ruderalis TaxID=1480154 RepID=A0A176VIW7_MARPO|nr:hypothetical protein AXG93_502s1000 [Marchantia polymorpha subsp. ruderalis]